ncbi:MAG: DUF1641 domain-containing protein [Sulfobacillus thermotolerans]|uniref:DUF1641 domain-containing protein n=1 Tax=Sulfobacillus thermotolerans TaxID=338644 RepID=A0ABN5H4L0_9FIRM|nr:hypothetical protein BXT84_13495 [Sulfobacillus thermotolerans]MCY0906793.1 DUF1641 domain-containing protein [Sulfobacillus thermotolerans]
MAQPTINVITTKAPDNHAPVSYDLERFVHALKTAGVLDFVTGLLEQRDSVLHLVINEINQPGVKMAVNNMEQLAAFIGTIPQETWHVVLMAAANGIKSMNDPKASTQNEGMGIFQLLGALKNPETARAVRVILGFLEGFGRAWSSSSKTTP